MDNILIRNIKSGDHFALQQVFDQYADDLYAIAFTILKNKFESEDIVQEVFIKLWEVRMQLDENGKIWSFIYVLAKRMSINKLRTSHLKIKENVSLDLIALRHESEADDNILVQEILQLEDQVLQLLPEQQRRVYQLSRIEGLTHKEIAVQMEIAPNTVKNHIIQALKSFRKYFKKYGYPMILILFISH